MQKKKKEEKKEREPKASSHSFTEILHLHSSSPGLGSENPLRPRGARLSARRPAREGTPEQRASPAVRRGAGLTLGKWRRPSPPRPFHVTNSLLRQLMGTSEFIFLEQWDGERGADGKGNARGRAPTHLLAFLQKIKFWKHSG